METVAFVLMGLGLLSMAFQVLAQRYVLREHILTKKEQRVGQFGISCLFLLVGLAWWPEVGSVWENQRLFFWGLGIAVVAGILIHYSKTEARALADASLTEPYQAMTPGLVTACALLFREVPSVQGMVGIALLSLGVWVHSYREKVRGLTGLLQPLIWLVYAPVRNGLSVQQVHKNQLGVRWAALSAVLGATGLIGDGLIARSGSVTIGFAVQAAVLTLVFAAIPSDAKDKTTSKQQPFRQRLRRHWLVMALPGIFFGCHYLFIMTSFRFAPIAYIGSIKRLNILLVTILAFFMLSEKKAKGRLWTAAIITLGAVLLAFDPSIERIMDAAEQWFSS